MGHYASEVDPEWDTEIERSDRRRKLKDRLATVPVGMLPCGEMAALMKVLSLYHSFAGRDPTDDEMDIIEARLAQIESAIS